MAMLQDDSTDEITCCYLQLQERLHINQGDRNKRGMSSKDNKQFCNNQKKNIQDDQSSSSSSLDMYNDPAIPGPSSASAYGLQNKKRQNGDKPNGHLINSKRTCLDDTFSRSPPLLDSRKVKKNGDISHSRRNMDLTTEPVSSSRNLLPGYTYEEHKDDSSECSDVIPWPETAKTIKNGTRPKKSKPIFKVRFPELDSLAVQCVDGTSEEDTRVRQIGALKGGRQSPEPPSNKNALRRKIRRVLDSDDSDSDYWMPNVRARPLIFSSSDSDDSRIGKKLKNKVPGCCAKSPVSKRSDNTSYPTNDTQTLGQDLNSFRDRPRRISLRDLDSIVDISAPPNRSNGPAISPSLKLLKSHGKAPRRELGEGPSNMPCQNPPDNTEMQARLSSEVQEGTDERNVASSSRLPTDPLSFGQLGTKTAQTTGAVKSCLRYVPPVSSSSRRRALGRGARSSRKGGSGMAVGFGNNFCHEADQDSSDLEFFTANSYSDNESKTELLGRRMGRRDFPEMRSNPSINVGSSEDEISVVYSSGPPEQSPRSRTGEARRRASRTLGRRYNRRSQRILPQRPGVSLSPDPVEQVRQVEEDERFARSLQAQFDAEVDPPYIPRPHSSPNPCLMNIREASSSDPDMDNRESDTDRRIFEMISSRDFPQYRTASLHNNLMGPRGYLAQRLAAPFVLPRSTRVNNPWTTHLHHPMLENISFMDDTFEALLGLAELNGDVNRGLKKSQINRLPTRKFTVFNGASSSSAVELPHKRAELNKECQVCLNDYVEGDELRILPCFHEFHTPCIDPWLKINHTCPVCRVVVFSPSSD
ncbi:hypothetical protein JTE90_000238 [Oedothorax gibbosus]|uniref:RING-type domain-containing protein n=1 Tax=Oedothorax gibbosus TaxID=931172 RepID=A0AAV6VA42_9ARAC|nr:hypothetical protein JTE90_000238 [Oedothorax gibbosus]